MARKTKADLVAKCEAMTKALVLLEKTLESRTFDLRMAKAASNEIDQANGRLRGMIADQQSEIAEKAADLVALRAHADYLDKERTEKTNQLKWARLEAERHRFGCLVWRDAHRTLAEVTKGAEPFATVYGESWNKKKENDHDRK